MEEDQVEEYTFTAGEVWRIASILRGAYSIRTADGEEDLLLADFIEALENADVITIEEEEDEEEDTSIDTSDFHFGF